MTEMLSTSQSQGEVAANAADVGAYDAIIVGAGFGGMGSAMALKRAGIDNIAILDRASGVGGTWHVNHYPGLAVDIASVTYSFSFAPNPQWSRMYAPGAELKQYAERLADDYDLRQHMRFGVTVESAEWDEQEHRWRVTASDGVRTARYLLVATGYLSQPQIPDFPGLADFTGTVLHTADWDDDYDPAGRRIAVIGTGATSVQLAPQLARSAEHLEVFQRTPIWVVPKVDGAIPAPVRRLFERVPLTQKAARLGNSTALEALMVLGVLHFKQARIFNKAAELLAKTHLRLQVHDPAVRRALTPDYDFGCKRPTFSNEYFAAFNRPNTSLVTARIDHFTADAIVTADGERHAVDTVVLATGFNLWDTNFPAFEIIGAAGRNLGKQWREEKYRDYEGMTVPGFPNLIMHSAPWSYSGLSYFTTIESQMIHLGRLLREAQRRSASVFEVRESAATTFVQRMTQRLEDSVFIRGRCATANSYYFTTEGDPVILRPTTTRNAFRGARTFPLEDYTFSA